MKFFPALLLALSVFGLGAAEPRIRVIVWDEQQPAQQKIYTNFLGNHIAAHLQKNAAFEVRSVNIKEAEFGLSSNLLANTDVLIWWGHVRHDEIPQPLADSIVARI